MRSRSYIAIPPGATIKEQLEDRGMSQKEFATRMDMSEKHISKLINGEVQLTPEVAYRLEMVLGLSANFWSNLEAIYREKIIKVSVENAFDEDILLAKNFPYNEMSKNGWIPVTNNIKERVVNLRKFFEVVELGKLNNAALLPSIACRRQLTTSKADFALIAWAQRAKIEARDIQTAPIDLARLLEQIPVIRSMTLDEPDFFCLKLKSILSDCGIALVLLPHICGSFLYGATFYDKSKIVMGLTVRGKDADKFWFSLFHEIAHILRGHLSQKDGITDDDEAIADKFAKDTLIPEEKFNSFIQAGCFTKQAIINFAKDVHISYGIVVGRLQKEQYIKFSQCNDLKKKYELSVV